jgi:hypothetical protein
LNGLDANIIKTKIPDTEMKVVAKAGQENFRVSEVQDILQVAGCGLQVAGLPQQFTDRSFRYF